MKRGEVWWVWWEPDDKRAVVFLSEDNVFGVRAMLVVPPAEPNDRVYSTEVPVGPEEGIPDDGVVRVALARPGKINCTWLVTTLPADLVERAGTLSPAKLLLLEDALRLGGLDWLTTRN